MGGWYFPWEKKINGGKDEENYEPEDDLICVRLTEGLVKNIEISENELDKNININNNGLDFLEDKNINNNKLE